MFNIERKFCQQKNVLAAPNFSGPWQNISTIWHYLLLQLYKTLPNPAEGNYPSSTGTISPRPLTQIMYILNNLISCQMIL